MTTATRRPSRKNRGQTANDAATRSHTTTTQTTINRTAITHRNAPPAATTTASASQHPLPILTLLHPLLDNGDEEIEFSYEGDEPAVQQAPSRSQSSSQQSAAHSSGQPVADVELPEANQDWLNGYEVMREESVKRRRPLDQQDRHHRTQLRQMYGELIQQTSTITPDQLHDNVLVRGVAMIDRMNSRVCHVTEEIQDAEEMRALAGKGYDKAKLFLQHDELVNVEQLLAAIHERFDNADAKEDSGAVDWLRMGEHTMRLSLNAPVTSFMRGVLNQHIAHKERKRTQRRQRDEDLVSSTATTLDSSEQLVDKQTHMRQLHVLRHFKRLTRHGTRAIWLYELLVDPNSFVRTVENFFDFSFLVKDNVRMEWMEWDAEMAFPMVRWRKSEQERTRERKRMERRLRRLKQRIAAREAGGDEETAADAESREREDRQCQQLVALLRSLNQLSDAQRSLTQSQAQSAAAERRQQAATDEAEANVCHFTPTLDYHAWSSIVIKFGLKEAKIPPMTDDEERKLRERMDKRAKRKKGKKEEEDRHDGEEEDEEQEQGAEVEHKEEEEEDEEKQEADGDE